MIALLEDSAKIADLARNELFGTRIYSDSISGAPQLVWWDGCQLLLGLKNGVLSMAGEIGDTEELKEFLSLIRPQVIMCLKPQADALGLEVIQQGVVMKKISSGNSSPLPEYYPDVYFSQYHELLLSCDMPTDYAGFCLETSRALRTGTGILLERRNADRLIALLGVNSVTPEAAIINVVAVDPEYRRIGLGRKLLVEAEDKLSGRELYILREEDKNENFYVSCGYENIGLWCVAEYK